MRRCLPSHNWAFNGRARPSAGCAFWFTTLPNGSIKRLGSVFPRSCPQTIPPAVSRSRGWGVSQAASRSVWRATAGAPARVSDDHPARSASAYRTAAAFVQHDAQRFDAGEPLYPQQLFLELADDGLGAAVALGGTHEGGAGRDAQEDELALEVVGDVLAAVVVAQAQPLGDAGVSSPCARTSRNTRRT